MASDWIKMRGSLLKHPRVARMAKFLAEREEFRDWLFVDHGGEKTFGILPREIVVRVVVSGLLSCWDVANAVISQDDHISGATIAELDDMAGIPDFGLAMLEAGWAIETETGVILPNFAEFNTPESERRHAKSAAERAKDYRKRRKNEDRHENVTERHVTRHEPSVTRVTQSHGDKNRRERIEEKEEKDNTPLIPLEGKRVEVATVELPTSLDTPEFRQAFDEWREYKREKGQAYKPKGLKNLLRKLTEMGPSRSIEAIQTSMSNNWSGLFEPRAGPGHGGSDLFGGLRDFVSKGG